jgi:hypothetical protein
MREVDLEGPLTEASTLRACVATILELPLTEVPDLGSDVSGAWRRWLGGLGLGPVPIADASGFAWGGPWIGWLVGDGPRRAAVMYGAPVGIGYDPAGIATTQFQVDGGFVIAPLDVALARPPRAAVPTTSGVVESIWIADAAGTPARRVSQVRALAGRGLDGDRHALGTGTFPSGIPGSALTLIDAAVCEEFEPPLSPDEHRRNVVTRGLDLNALVGSEIAVGTVRCRITRLCEPCIVIERYAKRKVLRPLVHKGGVRADILEDGTISAGDTITSSSGR